VPRAEQAQRNVVERRFLVAGHDDAQRLDAVEESLRLLELTNPSAPRRSRKQPRNGMAQNQPRFS